ncbi:MAG: hypothetical protein ACP5PV_05950 [Methanothrix sp.]
MIKYKSILLIATLVLASTTVSSAGLSIVGAPLIAEMAPGESLSHDVTIDIPDETQAVEFNTSIMGFGQDAVGGPQLIPPDQYDNKISATNIIKVTPSSFRLEPGKSQVVTIEANMPADAEAGTRYALVNIIGHPLSSNGTVNIALAVNARVQLTVAGSDLIRTGDITEIDLRPDGNGTVVLKNTGNTEIMASAEAELVDDQGSVLAHVTSPAPPFGIVPTYSSTYLLPFNQSELSPGKYTINVTAKLEDGTVVASKEESIDIK